MATAKLRGISSKALLSYKGRTIQLSFSLGALNGTRITKTIPLKFRFGSLVELDTKSTFDQMVKGMVVQPVGLVDLSVPTDVSLGLFL